MCGIFCVVSNKDVKKEIIEGLTFLEYRGYDSSGIALIADDNSLHAIKALGEVINLRKKVNEIRVDGKIGLGHTRWATHGKVNIQNTHPILNNNIAVVHNGIVENNKEIKETLIKQNYKFSGDTDTEVIVNLIQYYIDKKHNILDAFKQTLQTIKGNYAIAVLFKQDRHNIYCAKNGSPLWLGLANKKIYIASDVNALALFVNKVVSLADKDIAMLSKSTYQILKNSNHDNTITQNIKKIDRKIHTRELGLFPNYMLKEINEQHKLLKAIINDIILNKNHNLNNLDWKKITKVSIIACGSSYHAGMVAKYWFESYARISAEIDFASEFRTRDIVYDTNALYIFISQSGETLDTLISLKEAKKHNVKTVALVNIIESSIANLADYIVPIQAGVEISVASTKTFTAQLIKLADIVLSATVAKGLQSVSEYLNMWKKLDVELNNLTGLFTINQGIKEISKKIIDAKNTIFLGRKHMYPIALEGALKLKELSYLAVFSSAAGELKHGSIALIDSSSLVIALAPYNDTHHKMFANIEEVKTRGAKVVLLSNIKKELMPDVNYIYKMPNISTILAPILYTTPLQMLAYQSALNLGNNVDRPRNLAKSVTVE